MNKKVSTLLTVALTLGGSLLTSSAFAETVGQLVSDPATEYDSSAQYVIAQEVEGHYYALGYNVQTDGKIKVLIKELTANVNADVLKNFVWNISETTNPVDSEQHFYSFSNVGAGIKLAVNNDYEIVTDPAKISSSETDFIFASWKSYDESSSSLAPQFPGQNTAFKYMGFYDDASDASDAVNFNLTTVTDVAKYPIKFFKVESQVIDGEELNKLYNKKGFSFDIKVKDNKDVVENLFNDVRALDVDKVINAKEDGKLWGFPEGTYFVTKESYDATAKAKGYDYNEIATKYSSDQAEKYKLQVQFLRSLTFIAVSSTESVELSGVQREKGQGFELVTVSGNDLYDYMCCDKNTTVDNTLKPQNNQLSVYNACFQVKAISTADFPYSLRLNNFFYTENADKLAAATEEKPYKHTEGSVNLTVLEHGSPAAYYLTTSEKTDAAAENIFCFDDSNVQSGISFLKKDAPAIYNIRFVSGKDDSTERGKYLTLERTSSDAFGFVAKGEALVNAESLATPVYQFVITSVKDKEIEFTNRETGESFKTQLFLEREENGKKIYSLNPSTGYDKVISVVNIKSNSYGTEYKENYDLAFSKVEVELIESTADQYSGYLKAEDGTLVTMKFARDAEDTSNFLYATVVDGKLMKTGNSNEANLTDDLYTAAQWRLTVADSVDLNRDYAYNNNGAVAIKGRGDIVKAYQYHMEYVTDGDGSGKFLKGNGGLELTTEGLASEYIIRQNPNGSVVLIEDANTVDFADDAHAFDSTVKGNKLELKSATTTESAYYKYNDQSVYDAIRGDHDLLTFLVNESPEISWKGEEGHVTIQSEKGDYLTMADNNEAIIVDEANADVLYLHVSKKQGDIIPSFFISKGVKDGGNAESERMFLYNAIDSVKYNVNELEYDPKYQMAKEATKAIFKSGIMNETRDTLSLTVKGEVAKKVAMESNNQQNVWKGLDRFKWQIVETEDNDGYYYVRQLKAKARNVSDQKTLYLANANDVAVLVEKENSILPPYIFTVKDSEAPTSNEGVAASEVKVVAQDGSVVVKNAAGKNVVVSTILGQVVANEVLTSDNATINVPAGIVVVAVEGESFKVNVK